ncbi:MAG: heme o synthase [Candidatus Puniceispirillaceae bacterium]
MSQTQNTFLTPAEPYYIASAGDFFQLMKPRVMSLVVFTGFAGMYLAPVTGEISVSSILLAAISLFAIAAGAGASGAINQWYDRDIDALMLRTKNRPIPSGRVQSEEALALGIVISVLSVLLLSLSANLFSGALLAFTIFFYAVIYSVWLKRRTPQNIVIGGAAGALPPMVGWAAMTGTVSLESIVLFAIIFIWTPPHFWALALVKNDDYQAANIPMMPVVAGVQETKSQILIYSSLLAPLGVVPFFIGMSSVFYAVVAACLGGAFLYKAWKLRRSDTLDEAMPLFKYSLWYLTIIFFALIGDTFLARLI